MNQHYQACADLVLRSCGVSIDQLLAPISQLAPSGSYLLDSDTYRLIKKAREHDDQDAPRGVWEAELRHADWAKVAQLCVRALRDQSKDLQINAWLLEAQIQEHGFAAIGPYLCLIQELIERYWGSLYPLEDQDFEHRANIIDWINRTLSITVKQLPITAAEMDSPQFSWGDWELGVLRSQADEQLNSPVKHDDDKTVDQILKAINQTSTEFYEALSQEIELALISIRRLNTVFDDVFGADAPSLLSLSAVLEEIIGMAFHQLSNRGVLPDQSQIEHEPKTPLAGELSAEPSQFRESFQNRNDAYNALKGIADYLALSDPHSPAPFLIYKAIDWGRMNTSQLYQELFVQDQGQLNIFEMMGVGNTNQEAQAN